MRIKVALIPNHNDATQKTRPRAGAWSRKGAYMDSKQISTLKLAFDEIVHMTDDGVEYWYAREIQSALC